MTVPRTGLLVVACALLAACAGTVGPTAPPTVTSVPSPTPSQSPSPDTTTAVLRIEQTGGFMPRWEVLRWYPTVAVYADGRVISEGPMIEIYPGPALPNLQLTRLTPAGLEQIRQWVAEAGLRGADRELGQPMMDAGQTVFTVNSVEGRHRTVVWDLADPDPAIAALVELQNVLLDLRSWLGSEVAAADEPYDWDQLRLVFHPADPTAAPDPQLVTVRDWPLADLATTGEWLEEEAGYRCALVDGDELAILRPVLETANELSYWESAGVTYEVVLHPLLPDDEACPAV